MQQQQKRKVITKSLKAGEVLLKPGEKIASVYVIQSGLISLCQMKDGKCIEISQLKAPDSIADEWVFGPGQWQLTALALRDSVVVEIPLDALQELIGRGNPQGKILLKALSDRSKATYSEIKNVKTNREVVPCPADNTAKVFGVIFHTARAVGTKETEATVANWAEFRKFAKEVFDESMVRLEEAVNILIKLGYVKLDGESIRLMDMNQIEAFFDYYGNYHFKGGYADFLKTNAKLQKVTEEFLKVAANYPTDRGGNASVPYKPCMDAMKAVFGNSFEADQLFRLEQKGLFIKRQTTNDGGLLSFYKPDFEQMLLNWKILRELEIWNEKGYVDMAGHGAAPQTQADPSAERKRWAQMLTDWKPAASAGGVPQLRTGEKKPDEIWCSTCMSVVAQGQAACHVCGAELTAKSA